MRSAKVWATAWDAQKVITTKANQRIVPPKLNSTLPKFDSKVNLTTNTVDVNKKPNFNTPIRNSLSNRSLNSYRFWLKLRFKDLSISGE